MIVVRRWLTKDDRYLLLVTAAAYQSQFVPGRQGTGYEKLALTSSMFGPLQRPLFTSLVDRCLGVLELSPATPHDIHLVRYDEGSSIPPHVDPVDTTYEHHRVGVLVMAADEGGVLRVEEAAIDLQERDLYRFRPDRERHEVTPIVRGVRLLFTVGALQERMGS